MADKSKIEWTEATWNIINGCSLASPGCTNCYAMRLAGTRLRNHDSRAGLTHQTKAGPVWTGEVRLYRPWLTQPLEWNRPREIFVCAHGDLFHDMVTVDMLDDVFAVMAICALEGRGHIFQVLTKRSTNMRRYITSLPERARAIADSANSILHQMPMEMGSAIMRLLERGPLPNVWLGVSAEDQKRADERVADLIATPAAIRWLSLEPLLGPIDLTRLPRFGDRAPKEFVNALGGTCWTDQTGLPNPDPSWAYPGRPFDPPSQIDWVVVGGESGVGARPCDPVWVRDIRDQCAEYGVPFHFKQWGSWHPDALRFTDTDGRCPPPHYRIGKKAAGRLLDGIEHNGKPRKEGTTV